MVMTVAVVVVLMVEKVVVIVVLHASGADHHAAHLVTVSHVMYDGRNELED